jgi:hypothetical protein
MAKVADVVVKHTEISDDNGKKFLFGPKIYFTMINVLAQWDVHC